MRPNEASKAFARVLDFWLGGLVIICLPLLWLGVAIPVAGALVILGVFWRGF